MRAGYRSGWKLDAINALFPIGINALIGPNGAGKSTLLRALAGSQRITEGVVIRDGIPLAKKTDWDAYRGVLGVVSQSSRWPDNWRVREFLELVAGMAGVARQERADHVKQAAAGASIAELIDRRLGSLSGGQKQRVYLAAALVNQPHYLLLDEPTVGLDPAERAAYRQQLTTFAEESVVVLSTHLLDDVSLSAARVHLMMEGRLFWSGSVEELEAAGASKDEPRLSAAERGYLSIIEDRR